MGAVKYSLVVPVYCNEASIADLVAAIGRLDRALDHALEAVFVVDGSPDRSYEQLDAALPESGLTAQLIVLSRNFGSFSAVREGLGAARGDYMAMMAADLQEPEQLILDFFRAMENDPIDVALGVRTGRSDPLTTRIASTAFWWLYRRFVQPEIPPGGIDVFACNRAFRDHLMQLHESNTSLVGQIVWLGFRRKLVPYRRLPRRYGRSAWSFARKVKYLLDSMFAFSDLPIRALTWVGAAGLAISVALALIVLAAKVTGAIAVPGYAATVLTIIFFAALNSFGLGIIGSYTWRAYENTKGRPHAIVLRTKCFGLTEQDMSAAGPSQGANYAPWGGSAAATAASVGVHE
jgi:glycosyltransferase involved in cell wall biosynthesis